MRKMLAISGALVSMAVFTTAAPAVAAPHCKVISTSSVEQVRNVTGAPGSNGATVQHRTATTTVTKCKGRTSSATTYTAWS